MYVNTMFRILLVRADEINSRIEGCGLESLGCHAAAVLAFPSYSIERSIQMLPLRATLGISTINAGSCPLL